MNICVAGKNQIAVDALKFLIDNEIVPRENIIACPNDTDNGINDWQPSFKYFCATKKIKLLKLEELYPIEDLIFISLEFDKIIKPELFNTSKLFNIHFSLLPKYKGMYTSIMPILYNEEMSGVTLHKIDAGIDTGEIIDQISFEIKPLGNSFDLYKLYLSYSFILFKNNILNIIKGNFNSIAQSPNGSSYYSKKAIDFTSIKINLTQTAHQVSTFIRGYAFRPYQLPSINGFNIISSEILNSNSTCKPGNLIDEDEFSLVYSTIDYNIRLYKDKLEQSFIAAEKGDLNYLQNLHNMGYNLNERNKKGWSAFIVAVFFEQFKITQWFINIGFDVNACNNNGTTLLMYAMTSASKSNDLMIMELLINNGADLQKTDFNNKSVFDYACQYGNNKIISFLNTYK